MLLFSGRNIEKAQEKAESIVSESKVKTIAVKVDATKKEDIIAANEKVKKELGVANILI